MTVEQRWRSKLVWLVVLSIIGAALIPSTARAEDGKTDELQRKIQKIQADFDRAERERANTERRRGALKTEERSLTNEISKLENQIGSAAAELDRLENELTAAEGRLRQATVELTAAEEDLDYRRELLQQRVRIIYEHGPVSYLEVLLSSTSFQDFLQRFHALRLVVDKDSELFGEAEEMWQVILVKRAEIENERASLVARQNDVMTRRQQIEVMAADRAQKRVQVQSDAAELEKALNEQERLSNDIARQLEKLRTELASVLARYGRVQGKFPVNPIAKGYRISSRYGPRFHPILRTNRIHAGLDLAAATGTPIVAVLPGVVTHAGSLGGYGNAVMIMHGTDEKGRQVVTLYAHASKIHVKAGQQVQAGNLIASVGQTGMATGPHLHFEVRLNGATVNPEPYLLLR